MANTMIGSAQPQQRTTELIPITEQDGKRAVNARDLHEFLESKQQFADWIKNRIRQYDFVEGIDYVLLHNFMKQTDDCDVYSNLSNKIGSGGHNAIEYALTVNMAKELSMVEGNAQGKRARRYFIEREEQSKLLPSQLMFEYERRISSLESKYFALEAKRRPKVATPQRLDYRQIFEPIIKDKPVRWCDLMRALMAAGTHKKAAERRISCATKYGDLIKTDGGYILSNPLNSETP